VTKAIATGTNGLGYLGGKPCNVIFVPNPDTLQAVLGWWCFQWIL
jgi:hypothetical protein